MMKVKILRWCSLLLCALMLGWGSQVWADEPEEPVDEPVYQNPAQASHAANLADAYVAANPDPRVEALQLQQEGLAENDPEYADIDDQIAAIVAENTGLKADEIEDLRAEGMGWGEIAHELGVHPGVLGLGHAKKEQKMVSDELAFATTTDMQTGNSMGHGNAYKKAGMDTAQSGNGAKNGGKDKGDKGNNGNKGGNGNGGSNGGGKNK